MRVKEKGVVRVGMLASGSETSPKSEIRLVPILLKKSLKASADISP